MASIRAGSQQALLVVDVQVGVMAECWDAAKVIAQIATAVARARTAGVPVIWVAHADAELPQGSPAWQLVPELKPLAHERRIDKHFHSSFEQTELEQVLADAGVAHIVLAGAASGWCIRATAYAALERGYDLTLLEDAHSTANLVLDDGSRIDAAQVMRELNIALHWLSYPGRRNAVAGAAEFAFGAA